MNGPHILCELFNDLNHVDKVVAKMTEGNTASAIGRLEGINDKIERFVDEELLDESEGTLWLLS